MTLGMLVLAVGCSGRSVPLERKSLSGAPGVSSAGLSAPSSGSAVAHGAAAGAGSPGPAAVPAIDAAGPSRRDEAIVQARPLEDVFLVTGELHAVRSLDLVTPRSE